MIFWNGLFFLAISFYSCTAVPRHVLIYLDITSPNIRTIINLVPRHADVTVKIDLINSTKEINVIAFTWMRCIQVRPDLLIDLTQSFYNSESVKTTTSDMYIPTITTTIGNVGDFIGWMNVQDDSIFLQIKQPLEKVIEIVRTIIDHHKYENAAILYDDSFAMFSKLDILLMNLNVRHSIINYNQRSSLRQLDDMYLYNIFIIGTKKLISFILSQACQNKYFGRIYAWYAITLEDGGNIKVECLHARYVVATPKPIKRNLDINFGNSNLPRITNEFYYDIVKIAYNVVERIQKTQLSFCKRAQKSNLKIAPLVKSVIEANTTKLIHSNYEISTLWSSLLHFEMELKGYLVNENGTEEEHIADWTTKNPNALTIIGNMDKYKSEHFYKISVAIQEPFLYPDKNSLYNYSGICIDLIEDIAEKVGFTFELYSPEGTGFRYDFNATIKEVKEGRADIGLGPITSTLERSLLVDFTISFYEPVGMLIMMKIPDTSKSIFKIIEVLDMGVWLMLLLFFFVTSLLLWIFDKFSPYSYQNQRNLLAKGSITEKRIFTLRECFWFCLTSMTSQGGGEAPRSLSGKIVSGAWWCFEFFIMASYTANLAAFLTISNLESSIESLEDLSTQYKVKYGVINGSDAMRYFEKVALQEKRIADSFLKEIYPNYLKPEVKNHFYTMEYPMDNMYSKLLKFMGDTMSMTNSVEEAVKKVQTSNYAYIGDAVDIKFATLTNCDLQIIGEEFAYRSYSLAVQKKSPLKNQLNHAIIELLNERKLERTKNKWWRENPKSAKCGNYRYQTESITIENVVGVFLLIGVGVATSLIIIGLDNLYEKKIVKSRVKILKLQK